MNCRGFALSCTEHGICLEFVMPPKLDGKFFARLYCRGKLGDEANGDAARLWEKLAPEYRMRRLAAPKQVHGISVVEASDEQALPARSEADGLFINENSSVLASIRVADCAPLVIALAGANPRMAILHSGFKGTMQNIASVALSRFCGRGKIYAWIGPRICPRCYCRSKSDAITQEALAAFGGRCVRKAGDKIFFDIGGEIRRRLIEGGVLQENIFDYEGCTLFEKSLFYSYRGGDKEKRNFLLAGCAAN